LILDLQPAAAVALEPEFLLTIEAGADQQDSEG
jgi:hypothetical protein